jgi:hypothetical protein
MFELKTLSREAVPRALEKAERYRLLNEPVQAESICLDVLEIDSANQNALVILLLALTDQFDEDLADAAKRAQDVLPRLASEYERCYYAGIIWERRARAQMKRGRPGSGYAAYDSFREAMGWYGKAEAVRPAGNDDALLRWNACVRLLQRAPQVAPGPQEPGELPLE